jgi:hypothetical protein
LGVGGRGVGGRRVAVAVGEGCGVAVGEGCVVSVGMGVMVGRKVRVGVIVGACATNTSAVRQAIAPATSRAGSSIDVPHFFKNIRCGSPSENRACLQKRVAKRILSNAKIFGTLISGLPILHTRSKLL